MARRLVLASASPARLCLLQSAGLSPEVVISDVDEGGVERLPAAEAVSILARRKAEAVADSLMAPPAGPANALWAAAPMPAPPSTPAPSSIPTPPAAPYPTGIPRLSLVPRQAAPLASPPPPPPSPLTEAPPPAPPSDLPPSDLPLVIGCDSLLEFDGSTWGKPASPDQVVVRWRLMRGRVGLLHTGHCVIDTATRATAMAIDTARVRFGRPTDKEIEAYAATPEALAVAGPFTLEGRSAPWIDSIDGNYGTITGISLPLLRRLLNDLGVEIVDLWN